MSSTFKKRMILVLSCISFLFFIVLFFQIKEMKADLESNTILLDEEGMPLLPDLAVSSMKDVPKQLKDYLRSSEATSLEKVLYPQVNAKRIIFPYTLKASLKQDEKDLLYINNSYFGFGVIGYRNASHYYFEKELSQLSPEEMLYLIYKEKGSSDWKGFLHSLVKASLLTNEERKAYEDELPSIIERTYTSHSVHQSFIQQVIKEAEVLGFDEKEFFLAGHIMRTTLNKGIQLNIISAFQNEDNFPEESRAVVEAGMTILDHQSGAIKGMSGGRYYQDNPDFNRATDTTRQPASAFKPLIVYAPAIEKGWEITDNLFNKPIKIGDFKPYNYNRDYSEKITIKEAHTKSYNVPATWLLHKIGLEIGLRYIHKMGVFPDNKSDGIALAVGFTSVGTSPLAMAQAYTIFANEGKMVTPFTISRILDHQGKELYKNKAAEKEIITPETAATMNVLLEDVIENGTGKTAHLPDRKIAGKTGTTSFDGWFIGYDEHLLGAVWIGPDEVKPENRMEPGIYPAKIFTEIFKKLPSN